MDAFVARSKAPLPLTQQELLRRAADASRSAIERATTVLLALDKRPTLPGRPHLSLLQAETVIVSRRKMKRD